jgi:hypothetical protein
MTAIPKDRLPQSEVRPAIIDEYWPQAPSADVLLERLDSSRKPRSSAETAYELSVLVSQLHVMNCYAKRRRFSALALMNALFAIASAAFWILALWDDYSGRPLSSWIRANSPADNIAAILTLVTALLAVLVIGANALDMISRRGFNRSERYDIDRILRRADELTGTVATRLDRGREPESVERPLRQELLKAQAELMQFQRFYRPAS